MREVSRESSSRRGALADKMWLNSILNVHVKLKFGIIHVYIVNFEGLVLVEIGPYS